MGDKMKKYAIFVIAILALVIFTSGCTDDIQSYSGNGVSFNYPGSWDELSKVMNANALVGVGDPDSIDKSTNMANTVVIVQKVAMPSGYTLKQVVDATFAQIAAKDSSFQKISEKAITYNGAEAYELVYKMNVDGVQKQEKAVIFEKNGSLYGITGSSLPADFNSEQANFDMVINSFKVQ
jgi:hypothetical protein